MPRKNNLMMNKRAWLKVIFQNRRSIFSLSREAISAIRSSNPGLDAARRGWLYAAIGEVERALPEFETAIRLRSPGGLSALQFPTVQRALGSSPRYKALLRTAGLAK